MDRRITCACAWLALSPCSAVAQDGPCDIRWPGKAASLGSNGVDFVHVDVDLDGTKDVVAVGAETGDLILVKGAHHDFGPPAATPTGASHPSGLAVGDLDGDGALDALITRSLDASLTVGFGDGQGGFLGSTHVPAMMTLLRPVLADLDDDGDLDVVLRHHETGDLEIRRGDGQGGFGASEPHWCEGPGGEPLVADLDADGDADILLTIWYSAASPVLVSDGAGGYESKVLETTPYPLSIVAADVDDDGRQDLVQSGASDGLSLLLSVGGLEFAAPEPIPSVSLPHHLQLGDVDGDGDLDLMLASGVGPFLAVHRQVGDGFASAETIETGHWGLVGLSALGPGPGTEASLLMMRKWTPLVRTFRTKETGAWHEDRVAKMNSFVPLWDAGAADLNGDGDLELVACSEYGVYLAENLDGRHFGESVTIQSPFDPLVEGAFGDVDGDGDIDAVLSSKYRCTLFRGAGTGVLGPPNQLNYPYGTVDSELRDLDLDGDLDIVTASPAGIAIARGDGTSDFAKPAVVPGTSSAAGLAIVDLDGDGTLDVAYTCGLPGGFGVVFDASSPSAHGVVLASWPEPLGEIDTGDVDSNGTIDLVAGTISGPGLVVLPGAGGGAHGPPFLLELGAGGAPTEVVVIDVDGDARDDLVIGRGPTGVEVRRGNGIGGLGDPERWGPVGANFVAVADVDADGRLDAVVGGESLWVTLLFGEPVDWWTSVGAGCPGLGGHAPALSIPACHDPTVQLGVHLSGGIGGAAAIVLIGAPGPPAPIGWSLCTLDVEATQVLPVPLGGFGPGNGVADLLFAVPPAAAGLSFAMQAALEDPVSLPGFTTTNALVFALP